MGTPVNLAAYACAFGLGGLAISMEFLWHGALTLTPSPGRWFTLPYVLICLSFLLTAVVRMVLPLTRETIVTALWV